MGTLHCGHQRSELSPPSVQQRCFALLQSNTDSTVVPEPSNHLELETAMNVLERYLHCSYGLGKLVFAACGTFCPVLFRLSCIPPGFSPLPGIPLAFVGNLLDLKLFFQVVHTGTISDTKIRRSGHMSIGTRILASCFPGFLIHIQSSLEKQVSGWKTLCVVTSCQWTSKS